MYQPQVFTEHPFRGANYPLYFKTRHWRELNEQLIWSNHDAKCWICGKKSTLLIHHVNYLHLFHEVLFKDVYILCFDCHTRVHFRKHDGRKTLLTQKALLKRMWFLRVTNGVRKFRLGTFINYIFFYR